MTKSQTIHGPRITVQFEIDGSESNDELADMKKLEHNLEDLLAQYLEKVIHKIMSTEEGE